GEVEGLYRLGAHHGEGPLVRGAMALPRQAGPAGVEVLVDLVEQALALRGPVLLDAAREVEILDLELGRDVLLLARALDDHRPALADEQRSVPRAEEPGVIGARADEAERGDADEVR